ncbi:MAG: hypothetical protein ACREFQ_05200, partial [Stellaceae bacterium]
PDGVGRTFIPMKDGEFTGAMPDRTQQNTVIAVGVVEDSNGNRAVIISSNETGDQGLSYLRRTVAKLAQANEVRVPALKLPNGSQEHAEMNLLGYARSHNLRLIAVGAGKAYCAECASALDAAGVLATGDRRKK